MAQRSNITNRYDENIVLPRAIRFPIEFIPPEGFDPDRLETWPRVAGRLEYVGGRLLFMPPCGDEQQDTVADVVITLGAWVRSHPGFILATNEAGMRLGGETRAADAAIWRSRDAGHRTGGLRRTPPVLAVEVAGTDEDEASLALKASWYLDSGVQVIWLLYPGSRQVTIITKDGRTTSSGNALLPACPELPDLQPAASELFLQLASP